MVRDRRPGCRRALRSRHEPQPPRNPAPPYRRSKQEEQEEQDPSCRQRWRQTKAAHRQGERLAQAATRSLADAGTSGSAWHTCRPRGRWGRHVGQVLPRDLWGGRWVECDLVPAGRTRGCCPGSVGQHPDRVRVSADGSAGPAGTAAARSRRPSSGNGPGRAAAGCRGRRSSSGRRWSAAARRG